MLSEVCWSKNHATKHQTFWLQLSSTTRWTDTNCIIHLNQFKLVEKTIGKDRYYRSVEYPHQLMRHRHGRKQRGHDKTSNEQERRRQVRKIEISTWTVFLTTIRGKAIILVGLNIAKRGPHGNISGVKLTLNVFRHGDVWYASSHIILASKYTLLFSTHSTSSG